MAARRKSAARSTRRRGQLAPGKQSRGLDAAQVAVALDDPAVAELAQLVRAAGGAPLGAYREPLGGRPLLLASLPFAAVQPTPFQRDLVAHARQAPGRGRSRRPAAVPRPAHRGPRRRRAAVDAQRRGIASPRRKCWACKQITAPDLRRRIARLPHPRAQHREGAQPQGPQPRGDPHGAQPRPAPRARARASSARSSRPRSC